MAVIRSLTRRGWAVCVTAVTFVVAGRLLGIPELYAFAVVGLSLVAGAAVYVRVVPWTIDAHREVRPPQVPAGGNSRVELSVRNDESRRSPVLSARDPFDDGRRWARFHIAPLQPGESVRAAYRLPTGDRGIFPLGPLQIGLTDPFGLATQAREAAPGAKLVVYPHIDSILPLPQGRSADPTGSTGHPSLAAGGDDFYALRPYQTGDDLRRVHWPSSARSDELMIRQDELPWQGRITVVADLRGPQHSPESLELTLSAVASIVHASSLAGRQVRLVTTDGFDSGFGTGHGQLGVILGRLAAAQAGPSASLAPTLSLLVRGGTTAALAVVTTEAATEDDRSSIRRVAGRLGSCAVVIVERSAWDPHVSPHPAPPPRGRGYTVHVQADRPFVTAWNASVSRRSPTGRGRGELTGGDGPRRPEPGGRRPGGTGTEGTGSQWSPPLRPVGR